MKLASRTTRITPSPTLQLSATVKALVAQGQRVFDFTAGEPSFDSPDEAKQAAITASSKNFNVIRDSSIPANRLWSPVVPSIRSSTWPSHSLKPEMK
jgi:aspartate/methionine/tyrosine aminotransferase